MGKNPITKKMKKIKKQKTNYHCISCSYPFLVPFLIYIENLFFSINKTKSLIPSRVIIRKKSSLWMYLVNESEKKQAIKIEIHFNFKMIDLCSFKIIHSINFKSILDSLYKHCTKRKKLRS